MEMTVKKIWIMQECIILQTGKVLDVAKNSKKFFLAIYRYICYIYEYKERTTAHKGLTSKK